MKDIFAVRVGDTSGDGHGRSDIWYYRWVGDLDELECTDARMAFNQVLSLGKNIMSLPENLIEGHEVNFEVFEKILEYTSSFNTELVAAIAEGCDEWENGIAVTAESYLNLCLAIATVGYGAVLPIETVDVPTQDLGGYDLYN